MVLANDGRVEKATVFRIHRRVLRFCVLLRLKSLGSALGVWVLKRDLKHPKAAAFAAGWGSQDCDTQLYCLYNSHPHSHRAMFLKSRAHSIVVVLNLFFRV